MLSTPFLKGYLAMDASWNVCFVIEFDARYNILTQPLNTFLLEVQDGTVVMAMPTYLGDYGRAATTETGD